MNTIIAGAGIVGVALAEQLSSEGHRVTLIDEDRARIRDIRDRLDVLAIAGGASMPSTLRRAGIEEADMVIAVTNVDEVNLVVGMLAERMGVEISIVRLRNPEFSGADCVMSPESLGIDHVINPEPSIVAALVRMIEIPGATDVATLADGQILMLGFDVDDDSPVAGRTPAELREAGDLDAFLVLYIRRGDEVIVPKGGDRILPGDNIHLLVAADLVDFVVPVLHRRPPGVRRAVVAGASRIGLQLAEELDDRLDRVVLIEPNAEAAEEAANRLDKSTILHGAPTDADILEEASIGHTDLFCAVSDDEQLNMMASLLARKLGARKTAVLVNQPEYVPVMQSLGVDIVINPRLATVGQILMHVRRGHIHSVTRLAESQAELIEMEAEPGSKIVSGPLKSIRFPDQALVGAIVRGGVMQIPNGDTQIGAGERVIVYALPEAIPRIEKLFGPK